MYENLESLLCRLQRPRCLSSKLKNTKFRKGQRNSACGKPEHYCFHDSSEVSFATRAGPVSQALPQCDQELISKISPSRKVNFFCAFLTHKNVGLFILQPQDFLSFSHFPPLKKDTCFEYHHLKKKKKLWTTGGDLRVAFRSQS